VKQADIKKPIVIIGLGEMGGVFARAFLRLGHPVYPIGREGDILSLSQAWLEPEMVLVAVGEKDLPTILESIPSCWRNKLTLLQNELLPKDWQCQGLDNPTVISVWFEKKPGQEAKVIIPSPCFGPHAALLSQALGAINITSRELNSDAELLFELALKNLYILTSNICGLSVGGTVSELWAQHRPLASSVAKEIIETQQAMTGEKFDHEALIKAMCEAFSGDPEHQCMGRSAPTRLKRALQHAAEYQLTTPALYEIATQSN